MGEEEIMAVVTTARGVAAPAEKRVIWPGTASRVAASTAVVAQAGLAAAAG